MFCSWGRVTALSRLYYAGYMIKMCIGCGRIIEGDYRCSDMCDSCEKMSGDWGEVKEVWELEWNETDRFFEEYMELKKEYGDLVKFGR